MGSREEEIVPFIDECGPVVLTEFREEWADEYLVLAETLRKLDLDERGAIEHVGSTAIRGMVAKDVIDAQIRVVDLNVDAITARFSDAGFRCRPEEWNARELTRGGVIPKLVFGAPRGARRVNVHVRIDGTLGALDTLLFRDYLRSEAEPRASWAEFKRSIIKDEGSIDLAKYGQGKQSKWDEMMSQADEWAESTNWQASPLMTWSSI
jgi:GrpB-like predicted nucleotidyltransferase (UPF0157 family)